MFAIQKEWHFWGRLWWPQWSLRPLKDVPRGKERIVGHVPGQAITHCDSLPHTYKKGKGTKAVLVLADAEIPNKTPRPLVSQEEQN